MKLSVVTTLFNTAKYLPEFHARVTAAASAISPDFEIVLVNDGSPDDSLGKALTLSGQDEHIVVVDLSRNFGHHKAMMTGLEIATGDLIFLIDSDLEEPPEVLARFYRVMQDRKCDVVYGVQHKRDKGLLDRISADLYYRAVDLVSTVKIPRNLLTVRLMSRRYVRSLLRFRESEMFISGLWASTGYEQVGVPVEKANTSPTSYNLWHRLSLLLTSVLSFSSRPLVFAALFGAFISLSSLVFIVYLVVSRLMHQVAQGWTSVIASVWLMGGLTIFFVGLVGLYVSKIFIEVKHRPYTIVRDVYRAGERIEPDGTRP